MVKHSPGIHKTLASVPDDKYHKRKGQGERDGEEGERVTGPSAGPGKGVLWGTARVCLEDGPGGAARALAWDVPGLGPAPSHARTHTHMHTCDRMTS